MPFLIAYGFTSFKDNLIMWFGKDDYKQLAISLYTGLLTYIGPIIIGAVTLLQNKKLHDANEKLTKSNDKYRKLTTVPFLTFAHIDHISAELYDSNKHGDNYSNSVVIEYDNDTKSKSYLYVFFNVFNSSNYPITEADFTVKINKKELGQKNSDIYIPPERGQDILLIIPFGDNQWWNNSINDEEFVYIKIINALDFKTTGKIKIYTKGNKKLYRYEVNKYMD